MAQPKSGEKLNGIAITDIAIKQPVFITLMVLLAIILGLLSYRSLPVNLLPNFDVPVVIVQVPYLGANPATVADQVTKPIEKALNTINGVKDLTSTSSEGVAQIVVQFNDSVTSERALRDTRDKVDAVLPRLPRDVSDPIYQQIDPNASPVLQVAISGDGSLTPLQLRQLIDDTFVPALQRITGVGSVDVNGGQERQINVQLDLAKLQAYQLLPSQIGGAISAANTNLGLGSIDSDTTSVSVRAPSQIQNPEDIAQIAITGTPYIVGDVAVIEDGVAEQTSYSRLNGQDAVSLNVTKQTGSNTVAVAQGARIELERLFAANPQLRSTITSDLSVSVSDSVNSSLDELILAVIAAFLVVLLFFRDLRNTIITMIGLPAILIATFIVMQLFGLTVNVITLLAISVSVGLVIDDAIVVRENIFRYMENGYSAIQAASRATSEVALSVLAMTLTIIAVFLPVTFVAGTTGAIFKAFGITVAAAMAISLLEAFTFAPMLSANLFGKQRVKVKRHHNEGSGVRGQGSGAEGEGEANLQSQRATDNGQLTTNINESAEELAEEELGWLGRSYERLLAWTLRHRWVPVALTVAVLGLSGFVASGLKFSFFPAQASESFAVGFEAPPGTALAETDRLARQAEAIMMEDANVEIVQSSVGGVASAQGISSPESGSFTVRASSAEEAENVRERLRDQLAFLPGLVFGAQDFTGASNTAVTGRNLQIQIRGDRPLDELAQYAAQVQQIATANSGLVDIGSSANPGRPEVRVQVNPARGGDLGITNDDIARSVRALLNGDTATTIQQNDEDIEVVLRLPANQRASVEELSGILIPTASGSVPLSSIAELQTSASPTSIRRAQQLNEIVIGANLAPGANQTQVQAQLQPELDKLNLPGNVSIAFGGQIQNQTEGFDQLFIALGLSVLFVYIVLASQFGSFLQPLVIMLAMPFSFLGAFVALRITGLDLDINGFIGLILLLGLVVKNSILLVDFANRLRRTGMDKDRAMERAGAIRLRPILMTSTAIIAGAIPTALGLHVFASGEGGEFRRGLAVVLIGGVATSTLLTLLVVPTAYSLLDSLIERTRRLFSRTPTPQLVPATAGGPPMNEVSLAEDAAPVRKPEPRRFGASLFRVGKKRG